MAGCTRSVASRASSVAMNAADSRCDEFGQIATPEIVPTSEIKVFAEPRRTVAGPQAGPADEGEPGEQSGLAHFTQDVAMQQFLFQHGP